MKRFLLILSLLLAAGLLVACTPTAAPTETTAAETSAEDPAEAPTEAPTATPTEAPTEPPTEPVTQPETEPVRSESPMDIYGNGYNVNMLVGFDEYGRSVPAVSARREDKEVGIFYFLWLGQHGAPEIYDISHIRAEYGDEVLFHQSTPESPSPQFHWWEEPLFGYYNSADEWVMRRHLEMLTDAGVDFLVFDATNCYTYDAVARRLMKIITELRAEGWDAPQVVWMTHSRSIQTATQLYNNIYKAGTYPDAWYRVDGKPMLIAYRTAEKDLAEAASRGDTSYNPGDMPQEMQDFFYLREPRWPYDPVCENSWPYTEWSYPQPLNTDMISVSIASHTAVPFSFSLSREDWPLNWGRGYDVRKKVNVAEDINRGTFFEAQWKQALRTDPRFIMVTGWNEWVAQKNTYDGEYAFVDNVDIEYSRDAEPMVGGYEDAYFIQMLYHIRQYKYEPMDGFIASTTYKTIDISGAPTQWEDINAVYRRVGTDDGSRNSIGGAPTVRYEAPAVENNILEVRVTADKENLYFYIKTAADIVQKDAAGWMNIYIGKGSAPEMKGWESYEYAINRARTDGKASIEALNADYTGTALEASATYTVQGNVMQVSIPRAALGLETASDFYFKVADGVENPAEIMSYYASGRSLPVGRLSYLYQIGNMD